MISVETAFTLIRDNVATIGKTLVPVAGSLGHVLYEDIHAPLHLPAFEQSAMDGYAVCLNGSTAPRQFEITGETAAGSVPGKIEEAHDAIRIFTGAPLPGGANTVIKQEDVREENGTIFLDNPDEIVPGSNIRKAGSDIERGKLALKAGTRIGPASMGLLAALGFDKVPVYQQPKVALLTSGNEIKDPGQPLAGGQIYDSNSYLVNGVLLQHLGLKPVYQDRLKDDPGECYDKLAHALKSADVVITTGGISVGKYDYLEDTFIRLGINKIFYKVAQKPGKPLYFGKHNKKLVFGLPGNPAAVLVGMYMYVWRALLLQQGYMKHVPVKQHRTLFNEVQNKAGRSQFLKGKKIGEGVMVLGGQHSHILSSFSNADCLIYVPQDSSRIDAGTTVLTFNLNPESL